MKSYNIPQEKPFYVWKVDKNFKIRKFVVRQYTLSVWNGRREVRFFHELGSQKPSVKYYYLSNEYKFNYGTVFSFEDNDKKAHTIIFEAYKKKVENAKHQYELSEKQWIEIIKMNGKK